MVLSKSAGIIINGSLYGPLFFFLYNLGSFNPTTKDIISVPQILVYIPSFGVWGKVNPHSAKVELG